MKLSYSEQRVQDFLQSAGFKATPIPPSPDRKTADFEAIDDGGAIYIIEVESQAEDTAYFEELERKGEVSRTHRVLRTNVASHVVNYAARQILETPVPPGAFGVLALVVSRDDPGNQLQEFEATLYGTVPVVSLSEDGTGTSKDCLYFDYNDFFRNPDIPAAIIFALQGCRLYLNSFATNLATFRNTRLFATFIAKGAVYDPDPLEQTGAILLADTSIPRSDEAAVLKYVVSKYNLPSQSIHIRPVQMRYTLRWHEDGICPSPPDETPSA